MLQQLGPAEQIRSASLPYAIGLDSSMVYRAQTAGAYMRWFRSYDEEYAELFSHLTENWKMKPLYARAFLDAYTKSIGKMFSDGKTRSSQLRENPDPALRLFATAYIDDHDYALVGQAHRAYMTDLRREKHAGTNVEKAIWAILARSDLVEDLDRLFSEYIDDTYEGKFPGLFDEVFLAGGASHSSELDEPTQNTQRSGTSIDTDRTIIKCPSCSTALRVPSGKSGKVRCKRCGHLFEATT